MSASDDSGLVDVVAELDPTVWYRDTQAHEPPRRTSDGWFTLSSDFPPDEYARGPQ